MDNKTFKGVVGVGQVYPSYIKDIWPAQEQQAHLDWRRQLNQPEYPPMVNPDYKVKQEGTKLDAGKPQMELIDADFERDLALVLTKGAAKYDAENWRAGIAFKRLIGAIKRHINAIERREDIDPEWGLPHTAHLACEVMFLHWMTKNRKDLDDRYGNKAT